MTATAMRPSREALRAACRLAAALQSCVVSGGDPTPPQAGWINQGSLDCSGIRRPRIENAVRLHVETNPHRQRYTFPHPVHFLLILIARMCGTGVTIHTTRSALSIGSALA